MFAGGFAEVGIGFLPADGFVVGVDGDNALELGQGGKLGVDFAPDAADAVGCADNGDAGGGEEGG